MSTKEEQVQVAVVMRKHNQLIVEPLNMRKVADNSTVLGTEKISLTTKEQGKNPYPFYVDGIMSSLTSNTYHSSCLQAKVNATVGLGFLSNDERERGARALNSSSVPLNRDQTEALADAYLNPFYLPSEIDDALNPLCDVSWHDALIEAGWDFMRSGNGYLEVARDKKGDITNIWWMPFGNCKAYVYGDGTWHWVSDGAANYWTYSGQQGAQTHLSNWGGDIPMAKFGKKDELIAYFAKEGWNIPDKETIHEIIHFRNPMGMHQIYGYPDWLSATSAMELITAMIQFKYEFFMNRGVPEFMLFITGGSLDDKQWQQVENAVTGQIGQGNSHKSFALNIPDSEIEIKVERFSVKDDMAFKDKESLQSDIVSAHRVPPLLVNILIPGKLGATNEFANSLASFSLLTISPYQRVFQTTLGRTLCNPKLNGSLKLEPTDGILRKATDLIDVNKADTVGRMREEATSSDRDTSEGLKD